MALRGHCHFRSSSPAWSWKCVHKAFATSSCGRSEGFLANWFPAAVRDADLRRTNALIPVPTLVVAGRDDTVTLASHGEQIAATIPGARLIVLPAVHLSNVELPERFMEAVLGFLLA